MKIFLDTADVEVIRKVQATGLLDGVTMFKYPPTDTGLTEFAKDWEKAPE